MANTLNLFRGGAVGFIDWLDRLASTKDKAEICCGEKQSPKYDPKPEIYHSPESAKEFVCVAEASRIDALCKLMGESP